MEKRRIVRRLNEHATCSSQCSPSSACHLAWPNYQADELDLQVGFELNGETVAVPCTVGVKQEFPLSPALFLFVI